MAGKSPGTVTYGLTLSICAGEGGALCCGMMLAPVINTTGASIIPQHSAPPSPAQIESVNPYVTVPGDFPAITVTVPAGQTSPGLIFASNFGLSPDPSGYYLMILDNQGQPVFYQQMPANSRSLDFTMQPDGTLSYSDAATDSFCLLYTS